MFVIDNTASTILTKQEPSYLRGLPTGMTDSVHLANRFGDCLAQQFDLCRALETLADSLPSRVDTHAAVLLTDRISPLLRQSHLLEETMIFPVLMIAQRDVRPILERLQIEHLEDEDQGCEVREAVVSFIDRPERQAAEELGYMLRCLFISLRRHLAFDQDYVLPRYRRICGLSP